MPRQNGKTMSLWNKEGFWLEQKETSLNRRVIPIYWQQWASYLWYRTSLSYDHSFA